MKLILGAAIAAWLVIGGAAAGQRGYFGSDRTIDCKSGATTGLTIVSGPLNYAGLNPKVHCEAPKPSA
jgi:hypothetical protein